METTDNNLQQLSWRSLPISRARAPRTTALVVVLLATGGLLYANTHSAGWALFSVLVLLLAVRDYWSPTFYTLSLQGIEVRFWGYTRRKPWSALRSCYPERNGVLLSPFSAPHRLENFRGVFLRFENNRDEVLAYVHRFLPTGGGTP